MSVMGLPEVIAVLMCTSIALVPLLEDLSLASLCNQLRKAAQVIRVVFPTLCPMDAAHASQMHPWECKV